MDSQWYKDAVLYELDVRSFCDSDRDGVGDFPGLTDKLDYLQELGVTALVLGPSQRAPARENAHHAAGNDSVCGSVQDLERLLPEAHARNIRVITELLVSQVSEQALNVEHPRVRRAVLKVMRHWLDAGVDGLKLDGIPSLVEGGKAGGRKLAETHSLVKEMRALIDQQYAERVLLAQTNHPPDDVTTYFGNGDECHMAFNMSLMSRLLMAVKHEDRRPIVQGVRGTLEIPALCQWALLLRNQQELNLDLCTDAERAAIYQAQPVDPPMWVHGGIYRRLAPLFDNDRRRIELGYGLLCSLPGSPVIYYGDEIGMGDNIERGVRTGGRTPMQWSGDRNRGFSKADPARLYAPVNADPVYGYRAVNVEAQKRQPCSLLNWTRRLIAVRRQHAAFGRGTIEFLEPRNPTVVAFIRRHLDERILIVANLSGKAQSVDFLLSLYAGTQPVELLGGASFRRIGAGPYSLALGPYGFYWFLIGRGAVRPTQPYEVGAEVPGKEAEPTEAPAAIAGVNEQRGE
jgi:maltose alpha-D-glucosyltransferase/alpha-amylase